MDNLVVRAARELTRAVQENYYDLSDLNIINYSEKIFRNGILYKIKFLYLHYTNKEY